MQLRAKEIIGDAGGLLYAGDGGDFVDYDGSERWRLRCRALWMS